VQSLSLLEDLFFRGLKFLPVVAFASENGILMPEIIADFSGECNLFLFVVDGVLVKVKVFMEENKNRGLIVLSHYSKVV
jgi:hypothetical protein